VRVRVGAGGRIASCAEWREFDEDRPTAAKTLLRSICGIGNRVPKHRFGAPFSSCSLVWGQARIVRMPIPLMALKSP
jgi:hypothetical protein